MNLIPYYAFNERGDLTKARQFNTDDDTVTEFLKSKFSGGYSFGTDGLAKTGHYREAAIDYDFRLHLTEYLIEYSHGHLEHAWAPTKGSLRKALYLSRKDRVLVYPKD